MTADAFVPCEIGRKKGVSTTVGAITVIVILTLSGAAYYFFSRSSNEHTTSRSGSGTTTLTTSIRSSSTTTSAASSKTTSVTLTSNTTQAAPVGDRVWFAPHVGGPSIDDPTCSRGCIPVGSIDFLDLFTLDAPWVNASRHVDIFKLEGGWVSHGSNDTTLRKVVEDLNRRGIPIAFDAGALNPTSDCGNGIEGFSGIQESVYISTRIKEVGGVVRFIAMDEPFDGASLYRGPNACNWPPEKVAAEVAKYIQAVKTVFPDVVVGDIEGLGPGVKVESYQSWMSAFQSVTGSPLPFFHLDIDWVGRPDWPQPALQIEAYAHAHGVKFGMIYNGNDQQSDQDWISHAEERMGTYEAQYGGRPDQAIFQSWDDKPDHVLPETRPYTFTHLILQYFRMRTALSLSAGTLFPDGSTTANGMLTDATGHPLAKAGLKFFATPLNGSGIRAIYSDTGTVPSYATAAVVGFRVNLEWVGPGNGSFSLYGVTYLQGQNRTNEVRNPDFGQGLNEWGAWGNGTIVVEPSDSGVGEMLRVRAWPNQTAAINSVSFPVTAGSNYTVSFDAKVSLGSLGSGYFTVIFLSSSEISRREIPLAPATLQLGSAVTNGDGTFAVVLLGLPANTQLRLEAIFEGDETYWPAYAEVTT